jgi:cell division transport system ATP-binding protein
MPVVNLKNAYIYQNDHLVLSDVGFSLEEGEMVYLVGKTGSGKSSLLKTLYADLELKRGAAEVCDFELNGIKQKEIPFLRRNMGIVFQDFQLLSDRTVKENLEFAMKATGWKDKVLIDTKIKQVLDEVEMKNKGYKFPHELSGGEQQRVSIARALVNNPKLILADEPTGNLDPETSRAIMSILLRLKENNRALIMVTHDYSVIEEFPGRMFFCEEGKLAEISELPF